MAKLTFVGQGNVEALVKELKIKFPRARTNCEWVDEAHNTTSDTVLLVFEEYFMRFKNVSASILIYPFDTGIIVDVIGTGGGQAMFGFDWGIENSIVKSAIKILLELGFRKVS